MNARRAPTADRIPRWNTRPKHPAEEPGEIDFGTWHKDTLSHVSYCMDVDKIEYRIDASGSLRVVGICELIMWGWQHDLDDIASRGIHFLLSSTPPTVQGREGRWSHSNQAGPGPPSADTGTSSSPGAFRIASP